MKANVRLVVMGCAVLTVLVVAVLVPAAVPVAADDYNPACPDCKCGCKEEGDCYTCSSGEVPAPAGLPTLGATEIVRRTTVALTYGPTWEAGTRESLFATALAEPETFEICYDCVPSDTCESGWRRQCEQHDPYLLGPLVFPGPCNTKEECQGGGGNSGEEPPCVPGMMTARVPTGEIEFDRCDRFDWAWELEVHAHPFPRWIVGMGAPLPEPYEWRPMSSGWGRAG